MTVARLLAVSVLLTCGAQAQAANDSALKAELEAKTQALADAIAPGNAADIFFVAGAPRSRKVFYRDASGYVTGFGDRREGNDVKWRRVS